MLGKQPAVKLISSLERTFAFYWKQFNAQTSTQLATQYRFDPKRLWRFDFAFPDKRVAFEIEGGLWSGGRHVRGSGFIKDCEKYNAATLAGWRIIRVTAPAITATNIIAWGQWVNQLPMLPHDA